MSVDMKEMIAQAACMLLFEKKVRKLTVKDIVEECHITRQAFYYHFEDIPDVLRWVLQQQREKLKTQSLSITDAEEGIEQFIRMGLQARPYIEQVVTSNYGEEIRRLITEEAQTLLHELGMNAPGFAELPALDQEILLRYHYYALTGIIRNWRPEDNAHMDEIVHKIYLVATNQLGTASCV